MPPPKPDLLQGTLDMLILKVLATGPVHGFGISVRIRQVSQDLLKVEQGSLYPALYRLEERGWIRSAWGVSENNRRAR
ncbi:MAG: PadR family transcriptional regulator, partial [Bryobacteraceae bacterium]